ncbi:MAG TPA: hypothetical protein PLU37_05645 [Chitinophagaceae bacterium]|nr:hypothetical protein [Chitinophagaceae bacterium]MCB9054552.1 hypothetical protein [Chitinophagales bacterium]HPG10994.1 hypothetical protein [Chitinophagaceae bacterium]
MKSRQSFNGLLAILLTFSILSIISCQKENSGTTDQQEAEMARASGEANAEAESVFDKVFDDVMGANDEVGVSGTGIFYGRTDTLVPVPRCFTVTVEHPNNTPFPVVITIDFGTTGCTGPDGRVRRGKIITEYTARLIMPGAMATTTFDGYYVNDVHVEGTHKITNTATTNTGARQFTIIVTDGKLTKPNGNYIKWNSEKHITQIEGIVTPSPLDDIYKIEGGSHGQILRGNLLVGWQSSITEPLIKRILCRWLVKGRVRTVRVNASTNTPWVAILDFGNGQCDNQATLSINGQTFQITLP